MRKNDDTRERQADGETPDRPARPGRQCAGSGRQCAHVQRVAGRKGVVALTRERDTVEMADHRSAIQALVARIIRQII